MNEKQEVLQRYFGYTQFRTGQEEMIDAVLAGRDALGIMPTGSGKSLCYQIPGLILEGVTLVVSPLISLMKDQVAALKAAGVAAAYINSSLSPAQIRTALKRCRMGAYKIIYVAPERLLTWEFLDTVREMQISMVTVDEAHCISQWGQDFRPSYLRIPEFLAALPRRPVVSAFTATATEQVAADICRALQMQDPVRLVTGYDRPNLYFEVRRPANKAKELISLLAERKNRSGIIYCSTRKDTDKICELLKDQGVPATEYHAGLPEEERHRNQDDFLYDVCPVMVATNAFGMGIDKSNVSFVIHYNMPKSLEEYYQEAGRAGRDGTEAECILLFARGDIQTARFLIENQSETGELDPEQQETVTRQDYRRLEKMVGYCHTSRCLRGYILDYFGQDHPDTCGNCSSCKGDFQDRNITEEAGILMNCVLAVREYLGYCLGENMIVKVLRGSRLKRIQELGLDSLPCFGRLSAPSEERLMAMADCLVEQGLLQINYRFSTLEPTERTGAALASGQEISMKVPKARAAAAEKKTPGELPEDQALYEKLRALRLKLARRENVPVYVIFSNATLQDMARKKPATLEQFLEVSGVGNRKAEHYGEAFLQAIRGE